MTEFIKIEWTSGSLDEARKVARFLVQERLVSGAQITPWVESVIMWNNQLDTVQESKVVFMARKKHYDKIKEVIEKNCTYEISEIVYYDIDGGNKAYLDWLAESTPENFETHTIEKS